MPSCLRISMSSSLISNKLKLSKSIFYGMSLALLIFHLFSGFHRPLGVIPPSSSVSPGHSRSPGHSSAYHLPHPQPRYHAHYPAPTHHMPGPAAYGSQFPSHFYPEKLYQYWHHYYPRIPGIYCSPALCATNCVSNIFA